MGAVLEEGSDQMQARVNMSEKTRQAGVGRNCVSRAVGGSAAENSSQESNQCKLQLEILHRCNCEAKILGIPCASY